MDIPLRIIIALSIVGFGVVVGVPVLIIAAKRRSADKRRRRGIKDYNRKADRIARG